jgi:O-antigen/teichoic acid export membrane protein
MSNFKINLLSIYGANVVNGVLGILIIPLSLKFLGAEGYGLFSIYSVLASLVSLFDLGVGKNLQRLLASSQAKSTQLRHLQNAFGVYLVLSLCLIALLPVFLFVIPIYVFPVLPESLEALRWIIFISVIEFMIFIPLAMMRNLCFANERFDRYAIFKLVSGLTRYALLIAGILIFASPVIAVGFFVSSRFFDLFSARWIMGAIPKKAWHPQLTLRELKSIMSHSSGLSTAQIFQSFIIAAGSILVNRYFGLESLGKYKAAFDICSKVWFFSNGLGLVVFPKFVKKLSDTTKKNEFFSDIYRAIIVSWTGFNLLSITGVLFAPLVFHVLHIQDKEIVDLFVILLLGISLNAHANLSYEMLQAFGKYKLVILLSAMSLALMLIFFFVIKKADGIYAIGWAWVISQGVYSAVSDAVTLSILSLPRKRNAVMLAMKVVTILFSLIMIYIYFAIPSHIFSVIPVIFASILFALSVRVFIAKLGFKEATEHV